jgi:hypothetical protein
MTDDECEVVDGKSAREAEMPEENLAQCLFLVAIYHII